MKGITVIVMNIKMMVCILLAVVCPALITSIVRFKKNKDLKKILKEILGVSLFSCLVVGVCWIILKNKWTKYEFLYIDVMISCILSMVILPVVRKERVDTIQLLKTVAVCSIATMGYSILTLGQASINSDTATATLLARCQLKYHSFFPKAWNYANGDIWVFATNLVVMPFSLILKNQSLARMLASLIWLLLTVYIMIAQSKKMFKDNSWAISVPILLIFLGQLCGQVDALFYQAAYISVIMWLLLSVWIMYKIVESNYSLKYCILIALILIELNMSGIRYAAEISVPLFLACVLFHYLECKENKFETLKEEVVKVIKDGLIIMIPTIIGYITYLFLLSGHNANVGHDDEIKFTTWENTIGKAISNLFNCFGYRIGESPFSVAGIGNLILICVSVMIVVVVPYLQWKKIDQEKKSVRFFFYYGMMHNILMLIMAVFMGKTTVRYMLTTVFVLVIISARYIYIYWMCQDGFDRYFWSFVFATTIIYMGGILVSDSNGWNKIVEQKKMFNKVLVQENITKGYASYWNSYNNEIYSDLEISFGSVFFDGGVVKPYFWLVDSDVFEPEEVKTCLVIDKNEKEQIDGDLDWLYETSYNQYETEDLIAYCFDYDISMMYNGLEDGLLMPSELSCTDGVEKTKEQFSICPSGVVFGPYVDLQEGSYMVTYNGYDMDRAKCEVSSMNDRNETIKCTEISRTSASITLQVQISRDIDMTEFKIVNEGKINPIYLNYIKVDKLK